MGKSDSWAAAAAILVMNRENTSCMHFKHLANLVMNSEITTLGDKGSTPSQTLGAEMRNHLDVFCGYGSGFYGLVNVEDTAGNPQVQRAIEAIREKEQIELQATTIDALHREIRRLMERNAILEGKLASVRNICEENPEE